MLVSLLCGYSLYFEWRREEIVRSLSGASGSPSLVRSNSNVETEHFLCLSLCILALSGADRVLRDFGKGRLRFFRRAKDYWTDIYSNGWSRSLEHSFEFFLYRFKFNEVPGFFSSDF